jgi:uncharacterized protein YndB with AHSA1/START domain
VNRRLQIAPVRQQIVVEASAAEAFEFFTAHVDRWWSKSHGIGSAPVRRSVIEPVVGGRWYAHCEDGSVAVNGHVLVFEPASRLVVSWEISARWKFDPRPAFTSEVEVRFIDEAPGRTRVELEHRAFERMGAEDGAKLRGDVEGGWPGLLALYAQGITERSWA